MEEQSRDREIFCWFISPMFRLTRHLFQRIEPRIDNRIILVWKFLVQWLKVVCVLIRGLHERIYCSLYSGISSVLMYSGCWMYSAEILLDIFDEQYLLRQVNLTYLFNFWNIFISVVIIDDIFGYYLLLLICCIICYLKRFKTY